MSESAATRKTLNGPQRVTLALVVVGLLLLVWYIGADRLTPYSEQARVKAFIVEIVPEVPGYVADIMVGKNQLVEPGQPIVQIAKHRYELAVQAAQAALDLAGQEIGAGAAAVGSATAQVAVARSDLENTQVQANRIFDLEKKGIYAKAKGDEARAMVEQARSRLEAAQAELERAEEELGSEGAQNPKIRAAVADLESARLDLERTLIRAPAKGLISDLRIDSGHYAQAGQSLLTFLAIDDVWIEAYLTENNLGRIKVGDRVELVFDIYPGRIFQGEVVSLGFAASSGKSDQLDGLPTVEAPKGWLRDPQRFPIVIKATDYGQRSDDPNFVGLKYNSQVDVTVYTGDGFLWNTLAHLRMRLVSWLSYAY